jgi:outer membrane protein TolC
VDVLLRGGTRIAAGITSNFLRFVTGDPRVSTSSALFADIAQPILGPGRRTARETILQAERDLLYDIRDFTRSRQTFSIDIATAYYDLLQRKSTVRSQYEGYQANLNEFRRAEAEVEQGKKTKTQLGLSEEAVLSGQNDWINAIQDYNDSLDAFKVRLGLPMETNIVLDSAELDQLMERGLMGPPPFAIEDATRIAFANRLDYYTRTDQVEDVARRLDIAGEGLLPDIDLAIGASVPSVRGDRFQELDFKRFAWDLALDVDPNLNRKRSRNDYRRAVINYDAVKRDLDDFEDRLELDLRRSFRSLDQLRFQYEIQQNRLDLAKRRVFELELRQEMGAVQARDQIEAQSDLTSASISLTRTVVNHTIANLNLWLDMGILYVKENGKWEEIPDEIKE